jgi:hypothetical protein
MASASQVTETKAVGPMMFKKQEIKSLCSANSSEAGNEDWSY